MVSYLKPYFGIMYVHKLIQPQIIIAMGGGFFFFLGGGRWGIICSKRINTKRKIKLFEYECQILGVNK